MYHFTILSVQVALNTFTMLYGHYHYLFPEPFHHPEFKFCTYSSLSRTQTTIFSVSMNLPILVTSHKWNHTVFVLLCLAYLTCHNVSCFIRVVACVHKVLLEHSQAHLFTCYLWLCLHYNGRTQQLWQRLYHLQGLRYLLYDPIQKKSKLLVQIQES